MDKFDSKTIQHLGFYVYALLDEKNLPFYIGKGKGNRVFAHINCKLDSGIENAKYEKISDIRSSGSQVRHVIVRHGLTEKEAFEVEASLIDFERFRSEALTNIQSGHRSLENGLMTAHEVICKYNAPPLLSLEHPVVIININKKYVRGSGSDGIYEATRGDWVISKNRRKAIKYVLSEYQGLIVEVFEVNKWSDAAQKKPDGSIQIRQRFEGFVAPDEVRDHYINKSIAYAKAKGASNPIRYCLVKMQNLFLPEPKQWGLRGDRYLWKDLRKTLGGQDLPVSEDQFLKLLNSKFHVLTEGHSISDRSDFFLEKYAHGGMSSGYISLVFWREKAFPLLLSRFRALKSGVTPSA